jgi:hypothetical protein
MDQVIHDSGKIKAASQQYLAPQEEKALVDYLRQGCNNGYPLPIKFVGALAHVIARQPRFLGGDKFDHHTRIGHMPS